MLLPGVPPRGRLTRGPAGSRRSDDGVEGGLRGSVGTQQGGKGHRGPHRGPTAVDRASRPSAGNAGPSRDYRRSGPPGLFRHISPPHLGSPPWLTPSSVSSGSAATRGGSRRRGGEAGPGGGVRRRAGRSAETAATATAAAAADWRARSSASSQWPRRPPRAATARAASPSPGVELPGLGIRADSVVRARRGEAQGRTNRGGGQATTARRPTGVFRRSGDLPLTLAVHCPLTNARSPKSAGATYACKLEMLVSRKITRNRRPRLRNPIAFGGFSQVRTAVSPYAALPAQVLNALQRR